MHHRGSSVQRVARAQSRQFQMLSALLSRSVGSATGATRPCGSRSRGQIASSPGIPTLRFNIQIGDFRSQSPHYALVRKRIIGFAMFSVLMRGPTAIFGADDAPSKKQILRLCARAHDIRFRVVLRMANPSAMSDRHTRRRRKKDVLLRRFDHSDDT